MTEEIMNEIVRNVQLWEIVDVAVYFCFLLVLEVIFLCPIRMMMPTKLESKIMKKD